MMISTNPVASAASAVLSDYVLQQFLNIPAVDIPFENQLTETFTETLTDTLNGALNGALNEALNNPASNPFTYMFDVPYSNSAAAAAANADTD